MKTVVEGGDVQYGSSFSKRFKLIKNGTYELAVTHRDVFNPGEFTTNKTNFSFPIRPEYGARYPYFLEFPVLKIDNKYLHRVAGIQDVEKFAYNLKSACEKLKKEVSLAEQGELTLFFPSKFL